MKYFTKILLPLQIRAKTIFPILSMLFFFFSLNSRNSTTVVPIDNLVSEQVSFKARELSSNFCVNPFITGVPIVISPGHTLVYELGGSN